MTETNIGVITNITGQVLRRATEAASVAVGPWIGMGDKIAADQAAVDAFQQVLFESEEISCEVVIGEGDKDEAPMLTHGLLLGRRLEKVLDLAVDPLEGTTKTARGEPGGMSIAALGEKGSFPAWSGIHYMRKLVVGPAAVNILNNGDVQINGCVTENMKRIAEAYGIKPKDVKIAVLQRERNRHIFEAAEYLGATAIGLESGDVLPALHLCADTDVPEEERVHMLYSSGGSPEAVLTAAAMRTMGGNMQAMWDPQTPEELKKVMSLGQKDLVFDLNKLAGTGEIHFSATGITSSSLLRGATINCDGQWQPGETLCLSQVY